MQIHITFVAEVADAKAARALLRTFPRQMTDGPQGYPSLFPAFTDPQLMLRWSKCRPKLTSVDITEADVPVTVPSRAILSMTRLIYSSSGHRFIKRSDLAELCTYLGLESGNVSRALSGMTCYNRQTRRQQPPKGFETIAINWKADVNLTALVQAAKAPDFRARVLTCWAVGEKTYTSLAEFIEILTSNDLVST